MDDKEDYYIDESGCKIFKVGHKYIPHLTLDDAYNHYVEILKLEGKPIDKVVMNIENPYIERLRKTWGDSQNDIRMKNLSRRL